MTENKNFFYINDSGGRIGNFWWINSSRMPSWIQQFSESSNVRWGESGFGIRNVSFKFKIETLNKLNHSDILTAYYNIAHDPETFKKFNSDLKIIKEFIDTNS